MAIDSTGPRSRRAVLAAAVGSAAATVVGALSGPLPVLADGDDGSTITVGASFLDVRSVTYLSNAANDNTVLGATSSSANGRGGGTAISGASGSGIGVRGQSDQFIGVYGRSGQWVGVLGHSDFHIGVYGESLGHTGVEGVSTSGEGVRGSSTSNVGVSGSSGSGIGVLGQSSADRPAILGASYGGDTGVQGWSGSTVAPLPPTKTGVFGSANQDVHSVGVHGASSSGTGVAASSTSGTGIAASSTSGAAVRGTSTSGRGAVLTSSVAQLRLVPASAATHPSAGLIGDLFVDSAGDFWLCKGGTTWVQLA